MLSAIRSAVHIVDVFAIWSMLYCLVGPCARKLLVPLELAKHVKLGNTSHPLPSEVRKRRIVASIAVRRIVTDIAFFTEDVI